MSSGQSRVVTFGEIMLRLATPGHRRVTQTDLFEATYGGGEANVAVSLAHFGFDARFVSRVPEHDIGQAAINSLRRFGVDTSRVVRGGDRLGIYFLETGASQRASRVIYDRANSAVAQITPDDLDAAAILDGADWFHWTGITPALGPGPAAAVRHLAAAAKDAGIRVSCDLNFRSKLWTSERAQSIMRPLMEHVDVCICNEEDAQKSLGMDPGETDVHTATLNETGYADLCGRLMDEFGFDTVAITLRESHSASRNGWSAIMRDTKQCTPPHRSKRYDVTLIDRVGGGDSFAAGLIAGLLEGGDTRDALEFAVGASCLKQTIPGDVNLISKDEVRKLISGDGSGRVVR